MEVGKHVELGAARTAQWIKTHLGTESGGRNGTAEVVFVRPLPSTHACMWI